jgi:hypothetical protein
MKITIKFKTIDLNMMSKNIQAFPVQYPPKDVPVAINIAANSAAPNLLGLPNRLVLLPPPLVPNVPAPPIAGLPAIAVLGRGQFNWNTPQGQLALLLLVYLWFSIEVYHKTKISKADKLKTVTAKFAEQFKQPNGSEVTTNALEKKMDTFSDFV